MQDPSRNSDMRRSISAQQGVKRPQGTPCSMGPGHSINQARSYEVLPLVVHNTTEMSDGQREPGENRKFSETYFPNRAAN